ncbi:phosphate signaling complex protein PhoU [Shouchella clausii]|uniref:phosphate signaling complex protein PhoU n=1 Tax=Shouchella clausii TaxID=79880 RepID=UPI00280C1BE5|nr:phosphate signaling complex protein PhoU [Shouchella clausii]WMM31327.1 phosphate signaling complex protein PhoU [Shouchella clausii]
MLRSMFQEQLDEVAGRIQVLGTAVLKQLDAAIDGLSTKNRAAVQQIIDNDADINKSELDINEKVFDIIARQQPVATDLRRLIVVMKMAGDLERVADFAVDIAKVSRRIDDFPNEELKQELIELALDAKGMIEKALHAYATKNVLTAQQLAKADDEIDERFGKLIKKLFRQETTDQDVEAITQLAFIARYIERIADYATNLSEWILYEANGQYVDLN